MGISLFFLMLSLPIMFSADDRVKGKNEEMNSCLLCHSSRIIHSQRLTREAWAREIEKMERWGAVIQEREALLDYLSQNYSSDAPVLVPSVLENATSEKK